VSAIAQLCQSNTSANTTYDVKLSAKTFGWPIPQDRYIQTSVETFFQDIVYLVI